MADVVRLAIIYDVADASAKVSALDSRLSRLTTSTRGSSLAAVHLAQALSTGNVSAITLTRSIEHLAGPALGGFAIGVGLAVAAFSLWVNKQEALEKQTAALTKEVDTARESVNKLLGIGMSDTQRGIKALTDRIKELQTELNKPNWFERLQAAAGGIWKTIQGAAGAIMATENLGPTGFVPAPSAKDPRQVAVDQLRQLQLAFEAALRNVGFSGPRGNQVPGVGAVDQQGIPLSMQGVGGARGPAPEHILNMRALEEQAQAADDAERHARTLADALWSTSDALENFVLTGTLAFQQMLDNILSAFFRAAAASVIKDILHGVFPTLPKFQEGGIVPGLGPQLAVVHGGEEIIPAGRGPSLATNVTFTVMAMDSRSVEQFFEQNGGLIAAKVAGAASRSAALRRRLTR